MIEESDSTPKVSEASGGYLVGLRPSQRSPEGQLAFLARLQRIFEEGEFTATYKFALLVALTELAVERGGDDSVEHWRQRNSEHGDTIAGELAARGFLADPECTLVVARSAYQQAAVVTNDGHPVRSRARRALGGGDRDELDRPVEAALRQRVVEVERLRGGPAETVSIHRGGPVATEDLPDRQSG